MARVGRNEPCPCGSGRKFKRCHSGGPDQSPRAQIHAQRREASEHQRIEQQGFGRSIIATDWKGRRFVAVGSRLLAAPSERWRSFHDFLIGYLPGVLGEAWWKEQHQLPPEVRHPVLQWHALMRTALVSNANNLGQPMIGAAIALLRLAYDLYDLEHNVEVREELVRRLKNTGNFPGAHYETRIGAAFVRAGFKIQFENERDRTSSHCEFTATCERTGRRFSVEAKRRTLKLSEDAQPNLRFGYLVSGALRKKADHLRVVFVELGVRDQAADSGDPWFVQRVVRDLRRLEREPSAKGLPNAYIFVTNDPCELFLTETGFRSSFVAASFRMTDFGGATFRTLREQIQARDRHREMWDLAESMSVHREPPATFDGESPEIAFNKIPARLLIGERYEIPDGEGMSVGTLTSAVVIVEERTAYGAYSLDDGRNVMVRTPLTEPELLAYERHPDTFFGVLQPVGKQLRDPLDAYDWFLSTYSATPREMLLDFFARAGAIDIPFLEELPQPELASIYAERLALNMFRSRLSR